MAANPGNEQWYIKENGGSGESVGIASTDSKWFIAENVLRNNAEMICRLWNEQAADTKVQNFNNHQQAQEEICPNCNGDKRVPWHYPAKFGPCPMCRGTGKHSSVR